jgi:hypothetical protein
VEHLPLIHVGRSQPQPVYLATGVHQQGSLTLYIASWMERWAS